MSASPVRVDGTPIGDSTTVEAPCRQRIGTVEPGGCFVQAPWDADPWLGGEAA